MARRFHALANPARFQRFAAAVLPWSAAGAAIALVAGLWFALVASPPDYQQGETVRIMYVHVPAAWMALFTYVLLAAAAAAGLVWRHPLGEVTARAAAPIGTVFTVLALFTGSLWGKPMWGAWWVWDARLTSVLVLFLMYLGVIALWNTVEDPIRAAKACAVLVLVGFINIPIIKFSVDWWNTLHQPAAVFRMGGPTIHSSMLWPLLVMALAFTALFLTLHLAAMRNEILRRRVRTMQLLAASAEPGAARGPVVGAA